MQELSAINVADADEAFDRFFDFVSGWFGPVVSEWGVDLGGSPVVQLLPEPLRRFITTLGAMPSPAGRELGLANINHVIGGLDSVRVAAEDPNLIEVAWSREVIVTWAVERGELAASDPAVWQLWDGDWEQTGLSLKQLIVAIGLQNAVLIGHELPPDLEFDSWWSDQLTESLARAHMPDPPEGLMEHLFFAADDVLGWKSPHIDNWVCRAKTDARSVAWLAANETEPYRSVTIELGRSIGEEPGLWKLTANQDGSGSVKFWIARSNPQTQRVFVAIPQGVLDFERIVSLADAACESTGDPQADPLWGELARHNDRFDLKPAVPKVMRVAVSSRSPIDEVAPGTVVEIATQIIQAANAAESGDELRQIWATERPAILPG